MFLRVGNTADKNSRRELAHNVWESGGLFGVERIASDPPDALDQRRAPRLNEAKPLRNDARTGA